MTKQQQFSDFIASLKTFPASEVPDFVEPGFLAELIDESERVYDRLFA